MSQRDNSALVGMGLLAGLAGAGLALLLAPRSGRDTREKIHESAANMKRQSESELSAAKHKLDESLENAREMTERLKAAIKTRNPSDTQQAKENYEDKPPMSSIDPEI